MIRRGVLLLLPFAAFACLIACGDPAASEGPSASSPAPAISDPPAAMSPSAIEDELSTRRLELLSFQFASGVKNKEPIDRLASAKPGDRVYAYLTLRNRTERERTVHVVFRVNGEERTVVDLKVGASWAWRTWAYNTLLERDKKGKLELDVTDDEGHPILSETLMIR